MNEPTMTHLTFQDGVTPLQEFDLVMIPAAEAESIERKGLPQRDSSGNHVFPSSDANANIKPSKPE